MRIYQVVLFAVLAGTALPVALHHHVHGVWNVHQIGLAFFLWLNTIIAFWEICLFLRIDLITKQYERFAVEYKGRELDRVKDFFNAPIAFSAIFSPTVWAELWSSYAVFDESYANKKSFGFFIDIGNGFSTFIPTLLVLYGMTYALLPARVLGIVALLILYQMWYGTLVYFASFILNKRYVGHTKGNLAIFVGLSNGLWFTFPLWGIAIAIQLIYSDSFAILR
jgi:hypothetical protein